MFKPVRPDFIEVTFSVPEAALPTNRLKLITQPIRPRKARPTDALTTTPTLTTLISAMVTLPRLTKLTKLTKMAKTITMPEIHPPNPINPPTRRHAAILLILIAALAANAPLANAQDNPTNPTNPTNPAAKPASPTNPDTPATPPATGESAATDIPDPPAEPAADPPATATDADADSARRIRIFRELLLNPADTTSLASRRDAAVELVSLQAPQAVEVVLQALASGHPDQVLAVIEAITMAETASPAFLDALVLILPNAEEHVINPLCFVLTRYGDAAVEQLAPLAVERSVAEPIRLRAIRAMGTIRRQSAAAHLVALLAPARRETPAITDAACDALAGLTGRPYARQPARWTEWWEQASNLPTEGWQNILLTSLTDQVAELERQLRAERRRTARAVARQLESLNELFPLLKIETQVERLPALLDSEHEPERLFALERIGRLLRDSIRIDDALQARLAKRLEDPSPAVCSRVIALLDELDYPQLGAALAAMLPTEANRTVVLDILRVLTKRPSPNATDEIIRRLPAPETGALAAQALTALMKSHELTETQRLAALGTLAPIFATTRDPEFARLLAWIGDDVTIEPLEALLDGDNDPLRLAVADGFTRRGFRRPLLDRAEVVAIYPFAVRVLSNGTATLNDLESLLQLPPPRTQERAWEDGVRRIVRALPATQCLAIDDLLTSFGYVPPAVRRDALDRALTVENNGPSSTDREEIFYRLMQIFLANDQPDEAYRRLSELNGNAGARLVELRFKAALATARFDEAFTINNTPLAWIRQLEILAGLNAERALALAEEIKRRFAGRINEDDQAALDAAERLLSVDPVGEDTDTTQTTSADESADDGH
jgi:hypothetical protein